MQTKIIGTGSYLPEKIVTNDDLAQILETSDEWIRTRTGIRQRHIADYKGSESCATMGYFAAERALEMAATSIDEIDLIITATITPDLRLPSAACLIQKKLRGKNIPAFDLSAACAGSIYGLSIADSFIRSGTYKKVLFIASEVLSAIVDLKDRNTAVLFGDGASAAVLSADNATGFMDFDLYADGELSDIITIPTGGSLAPDIPGKLVMHGRETFKFAVRAVTKAAEKILSDNNLLAKDISFIVPHQANLRIIEAIAERLELPLDRFLINLDRCANTSAASLLLAYDEANRNQQLKAGDLILMLAIGSGFAWGAGLYRV